MTDLPDLSALLDEAIGDGPPLRSALEPLAAGKRAVRRRKATASFGLALCLVAVVFALSMQNTAPRTAPSQIATQTPTKAAEPTPKPKSVLRWQKEEFARYSSSESWVINPKARVRRTIQDPSQEPGLSSLGLDLNLGGTRYFVLVYAWSPSQSGASFDAVSADDRDFETWLADMVELQSGSTPAVALAFEGKRLVALDPSMRILAQVANPDLPANFSAQTTKTAAAEITLSGKIQYALVRDFGEKTPDVITWPDTDGLDSLADFIDFARARYESGEGLR